jgi:hypothetical protein
MAAEELQDLHRLDAKLKAMKAEHTAAVAATGSHLMDIHDTVTSKAKPRERPCGPAGLPCGIARPLPNTTR